MKIRVIKKSNLLYYQIFPDLTFFIEIPFTHWTFEYLCGKDTLVIVGGTYLRKHFKETITLFFLTFLLWNFLDFGGMIISLFCFYNNSNNRERKIVWPHPLP